MARMHSRRKGKSGSTRPPIKASPEWVDKDPKEIEAKVVELTNQGKSKSEIGRTLRDQYGVPSVKALCGKSVSDIVKAAGVKEEIPEDMMNLIRKAILLRKHLDKNPKDLHNKRGLTLMESKIRRLQKYYKKKSVLPKKWYYNPKEAALLVK